MKAYIDADEILYNAGFASQHPWYEVYEAFHEEDGWLYRSRYKKEVNEFLENDDLLVLRKSLHVDPVGIALYNTKQYINRIIRDTKATEVVMCFSGDKNFRMEVAEMQEYKGSRKDSEKPIHFNAIKKYIIDNYSCISYAHLEADDLLSIEGYEAYKLSGGDSEKCDVIICTKDKDLDMVPGWRYNPQHSAVSWVEEREGMEAFFTQILKGDSTDDIPGLFKTSFGNGRASASLKRDVQNSSNAKEMYAHVWYAYYFHTCFPEKCITKILHEIGTLLFMKRSFREEQWEEFYEL